MAGRERGRVMTCEILDERERKNAAREEVTIIGQSEEVRRSEDLLTR